MSAQDDLIRSFGAEKRARLEALVERYHLTSAQQLELLKNEADLELWQECSSLDILDYEKIDGFQGIGRGLSPVRQKAGTVDHNRSQVYIFPPESRLSGHRTD